MSEQEDSTSSPQTPPQPQPKRPVASGAIIGSSILIKGEISGDEDLTINGQIEGRVDLPENNVLVGDQGRLQANVHAKHVRIDGDVKGDISGVEKVILSSKGKVQGNIIAPRVTLEDGAKFKGSIDMDPSGEAGQPPQLSKEVKTPAPKRPVPAQAQGNRPAAPQRPPAPPKAANQNTPES